MIIMKDGKKRMENGKKEWKKRMEEADGGREKLFNTLITCKSLCIPAQEMSFNLTFSYQRSIFLSCIKTKSNFIISQAKQNAFTENDPSLK